ncbi:DNA polymerase kappa isoform X1 [Dioscorea cayenensis subsp. rotundata]|uniref:DNA polymerase kappa n=2 Tax=Dioscorea cayennensis subsp. rotundata TaxID=55577 RepID=A0AB40CJP5_DIOCR|nr:DNA polymerase kappa isoform X1 [Dioscorea cayenensis subsp. rotundata]
MATSSSGGGNGDGDRPWQSYHTVYTNAKAGMDGVDKERVQKIVYEMSKGSKYFENEKRKEATINQKIEDLRAQCVLLTDEQISFYQTVADKRIIDLEASRDLSKTWLHSDMDAFYAAVETLENPSLKGKPLAVGSMSMLCTANYEARKFGVRAAMPGFIARKLCPDLIVVPPNFQKYTYYSELTRKVFSNYDADFIATSLDEAYVNITDICNDKSVSSEQIASELRNTIYEQTGLTCSVGVAPNRLLAKVCSDINKPNGQFILPNDYKAIMTFISSLPIRKVGGIGKVTEHLLRDVLGINTCEQMLQKSAYLCALFSEHSTDFFLSIGLGLGGTDTPQHKLRKSMSCERTFSATEDESALFQKLADIAEALSNDMHEEGLCGRTLTLKLKTSSFEVRTRATSLQTYIHSKEDILAHASKLLKAELPLSLRLMGLRMSQFYDVKPGRHDPMQKTLKNFIIKDASQSTSCSSYSSDQHLRNGANIDPSAAEESCLSKFESGHLMAVCEPEDYQQSNQIAPVKVCRPGNDASGIKDNADECVPQVHADNEGRSNPEESLTNQNGKMLWWIDDYICSVCGAELPQCFIEERQEHSDYHLAEMLQKEESLNNRRGLLQRERPVVSLVGKISPVGDVARKKQKTSKGKFIPIDAFFNRYKKD